MWVFRIIPKSIASLGAANSDTLFFLLHLLLGFFWKEVFFLTGLWLQWGTVCKGGIKCLVLSSYFPVFRINEVLPLNSLKRISPVRFFFPSFFFFSFFKLSIWTQILTHLTFFRPPYLNWPFVPNTWVLCCIFWTRSQWWLVSKGVPDSSCTFLAPDQESAVPRGSWFLLREMVPRDYNLAEELEK